MSRLRITRLGHGGILYRSPGDKWVWVDRWSGAPTYVAPPEPWQVDVIAPTHGHFDHVGDDAADVVELAGRGGTVIGSHEMSLYLGEKGVEAVGMNKGGTFEAAGIGFTMVHAEHTGAVTLTGGGADDPRGRLLGLGHPLRGRDDASTTPATPICSATWRSSASAGRPRSPSCRSAGTTRWVRPTPRARWP